MKEGSGLFNDRLFVAPGRVAPQYCWLFQTPVAFPSLISPSFGFLVNYASLFTVNRVVAGLVRREAVSPALQRRKWTAI